VFLGTLQKALCDSATGRDERRDGLSRLLITGANSPASLSQVTISAAMHDDIAKWEMNSAGDPETQADSRCRAISDAKIFKCSTPSPCAPRTAISLYAAPRIAKVQRERDEKRGTVLKYSNRFYKSAFLLSKCRSIET